MSETFYGVVYVVTCSVNGKQYVGQTTDEIPDRYWQRVHLRPARNGSTRLFHRAIRKYGADNFLFEIIWWAFDKGSLDVSENSLIALFDTITPHGYNLKGGGAHGKYSVAAKASISAGVLNALATRPMMRINQSIAAAAAHARPDVKKRRIEIATEVAARPELRVTRIAALTKTMNEPGMKERLAAAATAMGTDPIIKEKRRMTNSRPDVIERRRASAIAAAARPETQDKVKETNSRPEVVERRRAAGIESSSRPETILKHIAGGKRSAARPSWIAAQPLRTHIRWHVRNSIKSPDCAFCNKEED